MNHPSAARRTSTLLPSLSLGALLLVSVPLLHAQTLALDGQLRKGEHQASSRLALSTAPSLTLRVTDGEGNPLAGAQALVLPSDRSGAMLDELREDREAPLSGLSDGEGRLRLDEIPSPLFDLFLAAPGFAPHFQTHIAAPLEALDLEIDLGTIALQPGLSLRGRVVDPSGRPLGGASIDCLASSDRLGANWIGPLGDLRPPIQTGLDGSFEIRDLASDMRTTLTVEREGFEAQQVRSGLLPEGEIVQVVLWPLFRLRGAVRDEAGRPVPGALLGTSIRGEDGAMPPVGWPRTRADKEGRFELAASATGHFRLQAEAAGLRASTLDLDVPEPRDRDGLDITLHPGAVLVGRITDLEGNPLAGARVHVSGAAKGLERMESPRACTGSKGEFRIDGLEKGWWNLGADGNGFVPAQRRVEIRAGRARVELRLQASRQIAGRVLDPEGRPVRQAQVSFEGERSALSISTEEDGTFLIHELEPDSYSVQASHSRFAPTEPVRLDLRAGPGPALELHLRQGAALHGRVAGPPAELLPEVRLLFTRDGAQGLQTRRAQPNSRGEYRVEGLEAGEWTVELQLYLRNSRATVTLGGPGSETALDLELPMGETLQGKLSLDGEPLAGASLLTFHLEGQSGWPTAFAETGKAGEFRLEGLQPGTHLLQIHYTHADGSKAEERREISIPAAGGLAIDLRSPG